MTSVLSWLRGDTPAPEGDRVDSLSEGLRQEQETNLLLQESVADLELALEDAQWQRITADGAMEFTRDGLKRIASLCRLMAVKNPLIKRGLALRTVYVWGLGVQVSARAAGGDGGDGGKQDVNAVVQAFLDDAGNRKVLVGDQAHEEKERALGTDGNVFLACFTSPLTGRVQVRTIPFEEIDDVITNPEDRAQPWFYKRVWDASTTDLVTGQPRTERRTDYYPALDYRPRTRIRNVGSNTIHWDAPVLHVRVNALDGWKFGVPDTYAAIDWASAWKDFLTDWAKLVKALSRFAWRATAPGSKRTKAAAAMASAPTSDPLTRQPLDVGAAAFMAPGQTLEAIPKTGATIDAESGRPLAMMVAAALDVPVTMLLADPGQTGARATAETLDRPTELMAGMRRRLWTAVLTELLGYVVDQAVIAPRGPLKGTVTRDEDGQLVVVLAGDTDRTIEVSWPDLDEIDVAATVKAITEADATGKIPPLVIARLLLEALGVPDIDEVLADLTDDNGDFISPDVTAGQVAVNAFRAGADPVGALTGEPATAGAPATNATA